MLRMSRIRLVRMVRYAEIARFEDPDGYPAMKMSNLGFSLPGVASNDLFPKDHSWAMLKGAKSSGGSASNVSVGICFISSKVRAWNKENKVSDCIYLNCFVLHLSSKQGVLEGIWYTLERGFYQTFSKTVSYPFLKKQTFWVPTITPYSGNTACGSGRRVDFCIPLKNVWLPLRA